MEKKWIAVILSMTLVLMVILASCGKPAETGNTSNASASKTSASSAATSSTPASTESAASATTTTGGATKAAIFDLYNKVKIDASKTEVNSALKVDGKENSDIKNSYTYINAATGFGVYVVFDEQDKVTSKTLEYRDSKSLAVLCKKPVTEKQADSLTKDMDYDAVKAALGGDGIERNVTENSYDGNKLSYMYYWVNKDGSLIQVIFGTSGKMLDAMWHSD